MADAGKIKVASKSRQYRNVSSKEARAKKSKNGGKCRGNEFWESSILLSLGPAGDVLWGREETLRGKDWRQFFSLLMDIFRGPKRSRYC